MSEQLESEDVAAPQFDAFATRRSSWRRRAQQPDRVRAASRLTVTLCLVAGVTAGMQMGKAPLGLPSVRGEFHLGLDHAAWIISAFPLIGAVIGVVAGKTAQRLGSRRVLLAGLALLAAGGALSALAPTYPPVLIGRMIEGLGFLAVTISAPSIIHADAHAADRKLAMALWSACVPVGIALTLLAGPFIIGPFGWRGLWLAGTCQVAAVLLMEACLLRGEPAGPRSPKRSAGTVHEVVALRQPLLFALVAGCYMFLFSMTALLPVMFVDRFGLQLRAASNLVAPVILAGLAGGLAARWLSERRVAPWLSIICCAAVMGGAGVGIFSAPLPLTIVFGLCLVFAICAGVLPAIAFDGAAASVPDLALVPVAMGMVMQASNVGVFVGPLVYGRIIHAGGWSAGAFPILQCVVILAVAGLLLRSQSAVDRRISQDA